MNFQQYSQFPKDIKRSIAHFLDDRDILNYCLVNKEQHSKVCNEQFFHNVLLARYPDTLKYRNTSFKKWYLSVINYVDLLNREYGFDYRKYNQGNPQRQYKIFGKLKDKKDMNELLILSCKKGELALVKFALDNGADISIEDDEPLQYASRDGHLEIVKYLVEHGADIHANGDSALRLASHYGYLEIVKYLVENGAKIHAVDDDALRYASHNGHLEVVKYLVEHGANVHAFDDAALRWSSRAGHLEIVKYLVEHGADIHIEDDEALHVARYNKHWDVVNYLESLP